MTKQYTVILTGDQHINSTVGLLAPRCELDDGNVVDLSLDQSWLWHNWCELVERVSKIRGDKTWVFNGDIIEMDAKGRSDQLITRNPATMVKLAIETLEAAHKAATRSVFIRGTQAHAGKSSAVEEMLGCDCKTAVMDGSNASWWRWVASIGGVVLDIKHTGRVGGERWTGPNPLNKLAVKAEGWRHKPNLVVRAHCHQTWDTGDNYRVRVMTLLPWQLQTEYTNHQWDEDWDRVGAMIVTIRDGQYSVEKVKWEKPRFREIWTLE